MGGTEAEGGDVVVERYFGAVNDALSYYYPEVSHVHGDDITAHRKAKAKSQRTVTNRG